MFLSCFYRAVHKKWNTHALRRSSSWGVSETISLDPCSEGRPYWTPEHCVHCDRPSLQLSRPIVSETVRLLDLHKACVFHTFYVLPCIMSLSSTYRQSRRRDVFMSAMQASICNFVFLWYLCHYIDGFGALVGVEKRIAFGFKMSEAKMPVCGVKAYSVDLLNVVMHELYNSYVTCTVLLLNEPCTWAELSVGGVGLQSLS